jgi:hypothetical protein
MSGTKRELWRNKAVWPIAVLLIWVAFVQWLNNYTLDVQVEESGLRIDCEKFVYEGAALHEVMRDFENLDYDVSVEGNELSASRLVPFNGPLHGMSVTVGVIMRFENGKAARFRVYKSARAL